MESAWSCVILTLEIYVRFYSFESIVFGPIYVIILTADAAAVAAAAKSLCILVIGFMIEPMLVSIWIDSSLAHLDHTTWFMSEQVVLDRETKE